MLAVYFKKFYDEGRNTTVSPFIIDARTNGWCLTEPLLRSKTSSLVLYLHEILCGRGRVVYLNIPFTSATILPLIECS